MLFCLCAVNWPNGNWFGHLPVAVQGRHIVSHIPEAAYVCGDRHNNFLWKFHPGHVVHRPMQCVAAAQLSSYNGRKTLEMIDFVSVERYLSCYRHFFCWNVASSLVANFICESLPAAGPDTVYFALQSQLKIFC